MASLSPDGEELVEAGRAVLRADGADMDRVEAALRERLGPSAFGPVGAPTPLVGKAVLVTLAAAAALVVGGAGVLLGDDDKPLARSAPAPIERAEPARATAPTPEVTSTAPTPAKAAPPPRPTAPLRAAESSSVSPNTLSQEVALLSQANNAFRGGRPAEALQILAEHQHRFANGTLAQERSAARVQALCSLGRRSEGLLELERLSKRWPGSPLEARAKRACGVGAKE